MKAILFDLDGTLIDSSEGITKSTQYALAHYGIIENDLSKFYKFIGPPLVVSFKKYYDFPEEQAVEAVAVYRERYNKIGLFECSLYPGVRECIEKLKAQGYLIGMASSKPEVSCRRILEHFGILELFDDVVGATFDGRIDTKEEVLNEVMRRQNQVVAVLRKQPRKLPSEPSRSARNHRRVFHSLILLHCSLRPENLPERKNMLIK